MKGAVPQRLDPILEQMFGARKRPFADKDRVFRPGGRLDGDLPGAGRAGGGSRVSPRGRIYNAYRVPQAVIKITRGGRTSGGNALRNQLQYISRGGANDIEMNGGEIAEAGENGRYGEIAEDWQRDFDAMDKRATFHTYHVVISYPFRTDPAVARMAASQFADELTGGRYGDQWKYAMAHHRDTAFPHSHLILNRRGADGKTLHLSRYGISVQDLRDLHVETAGRYGILLNATSRASRNVDTRTPSSGRVHAARQGRAFPDPAVEPQSADVFPFYGASRREEIDTEAIDAARKAEAAEVERLAGAFAILSKTLATDGKALEIARKLQDSAEQLRAGRALREDDHMADTLTEDDVRSSRFGSWTTIEPDYEMRGMAGKMEGRAGFIAGYETSQRGGDGPGIWDRSGRSYKTAAEAIAQGEKQFHDGRQGENRGGAADSRPKADSARTGARRSAIDELQGRESRPPSDEALRKISADVRQLFERTMSNVDRLESEEDKTRAEIAASRVLQGYAPMLHDDDRKKLGRALEIDNGEDVVKDDSDPVRQRLAAKTDAGQADRTKPLDPRQKAADERLEQADQDVRSLFRDRGLNGDLALNRIKEGGEVDRGTRDKWLERDIRTHAQSQNISDEKARSDVIGAYRDASKVYSKARDDIRGINREFAAKPERAARGPGEGAERKAAPDGVTRGKGREGAKGRPAKDRNRDPGRER